MVWDGGDVAASTPPGDKEAMVATVIHANAMLEKTVDGEMDDSDGSLAVDDNIVAGTGCCRCICSCLS